jgi:hypothetical protein
MAIVCPFFLYRTPILLKSQYAFQHPPLFLSDIKPLEHPFPWPPDLLRQAKNGVYRAPRHAVSQGK